MLGDTIFAVASPPGGAARGIVRVSGPAAVQVVAGLLAASPDRPALERRRGVVAAEVSVLGFAVPVRLLVMPAPASYTGEDVVELHLLGSPLLLEQVCALLRGSARDATPGEFTRRAFENGKLDLAQAEAVLQLIHAADADAGERAAAVLAGGLSRAVAAVRSRLDDARATLEAGLDFAEDETGAVEPAEVEAALAAVTGALEELSAQAPAGRSGGELLLVGAANAGKSTLVNALCPAARHAVAARPGTTRDVLRAALGPGVVLLDAAGDFAGGAAVDRAAIDARDEAAGQAAGAIGVVDLAAPAPLPSLRLPLVAWVGTKLDLMPDVTAAVEVPAGVPAFRVSAHTGAGIDALRRFLAERCGAYAGGDRGAGARIADLLERCRAAVGTARAALAAGEAPEIVALLLREAVEELDAVDGSSSPEDVLDRVFAAFCLGK